MTRKPDIKYDQRKDNSLRPSWSDNGDYIHEHKAIFNKTKDIPGWQMEGDTFKLYEMSHHAGDVILEIGTYGGRSAVVEILGALSRPIAPQFYGVNVDTDSIKRTYETLKQFNLSEHALLYRGSLDKFVSDFPIQPTMCFVDGDHRYEGVKKDLVLLSSFLRPGVPVLCHDYLNPENDTGDYGVRKAATEWEADGYAEFYGVFGCAALFVTTDKCSGRRGRLSTDRFKSRRKELLVSYGLEDTIDNSISQSIHTKYKTWLLDHLSWRLRKLARKIVKPTGSQVKAVDRKITGQGNGKVQNKIEGNNNVLNYNGSILSSVVFDIIGNNNVINIGNSCFLDSVTFYIRGNNHAISIGEGCRFNRGGSIWFEDSFGKLEIGDSSTFEDVHLAVTEPGSVIKIGRDCMFAYDIDIRTGDSHSIIDIKKNERINFAQDVSIGDHVWIAAHCIILKGTYISDESVLASGSVVTKKFSQKGVIIAGNPARVVKEGISWLRDRIDNPH